MHKGSSFGLQVEMCTSRLKHSSPWEQPSRSAHCQPGPGFPASERTTGLQEHQCILGWESDRCSQCFQIFIRMDPSSATLQMGEFEQSCLPQLICKSERVTGSRMKEPLLTQFNHKLSFMSTGRTPVERGQARP